MKSSFIAAVALTLSMPFTVLADSPDKEAKEAQHRQMELEREAQKRERENERESAKSEREAMREERKHREEMAREERKHQQEMAREKRKHLKEISRELEPGERSRLQTECSGRRGCEEALLRQIARDRAAEATGVVPGSAEDELIRLGTDILIDRTLGQ